MLVRTDLLDHPMGAFHTKPYSPEFRERAVRLLMEHRDEYRSEAAALVAIAGKLGCSLGSLRVWTRQVQRDACERHLRSGLGHAASSARIGPAQPLVARGFFLSLICGKYR